jgi:hypothetical protein
MENGELKILVYLGPTLPVMRAMEFLPFGIYRPPARQGDIVSDLVNYNPTHVFLIDGVFNQNLSPWHKELVYALQYPNVKGVYGAASMGALRAADLDYLGMTGVGTIYEWYRDQVTEDDADVAVNFSVRKGRYLLRSVPLVDIRAGVEAIVRAMPEDPVAKRARDFLDEMRGVYYMDRTPELCHEAWGISWDTPFPFIPQKEADAIELLSNYAKYEPKIEVKPEPDHLSHFFQAQYERDRKVRINGVEIPQQHVEAHVILHNPEYERICWDSANQELALMLCNCLAVTVGIEEISRESERFWARAGLESLEQFNQFLESNGWSQHEFERVMIQNARIRKLQHALTVTKMYRRNTQSVLDYLRTHLGFEYWAREAVALEQKLTQSGVDDYLTIDVETPVFTLLAEHMEREGLELKSSPEEFLLETGFLNLQELGIALTRTNAGKEA